MQGGSSDTKKSQTRALSLEKAVPLLDSFFDVVINQQRAARKRRKKGMAIRLQATEEHSLSEKKSRCCSASRLLGKTVFHSTSCRKSRKKDTKCPGSQMSKFLENDNIWADLAVMETERLKMMEEEATEEEALQLPSRKQHMSHPLKNFPGMFGQLKLSPISVPHHTGCGAAAEGLNSDPTLRPEPFAGRCF